MEAEKVMNGIEKIKDLYDTKIEISDDIPNEMPKDMVDTSGLHPLSEEYFQARTYGFQKEFLLKEAYNSAGMYTFVSLRWIVPFAKWIGNRKVMEVMAGRGFLSKALREQGITVHASDNFSWPVRTWSETVTDVIEMDALEAVEKHGMEHDILIMGWPYMDDTAYRIIKHLYEVNPKALVVYIGEPSGGCTADELFFDHFEMIEDEDFDRAAIYYQSWEYIHDRLWLGRYKK